MQTEPTMDEPANPEADVSGAGKRLAQRLFVIAENRLQLLMLEAQEERERVLLAIWLALGAAAFGLLAGVALTVAIAVALWDHSPLAAMVVLTIVYLLAAAFFYWRLVQLHKNWHTLEATLDQLKKDRECFEKDVM